MSEALESSYRKRKTIVLVGVAAMLLICVAWLFFQHANAAGFLTTNLKEPYEEWRKMITAEISDGMTESISALFSQEQVTERTSKTPSVNEMFKGVRYEIENRTEFKGVKSVIMAVALILIFTYSIIELVKELQRSDPSVEMWARFFILVTVATICVLNYEILLNFIEKLGNYVLDEFIKIKKASNGAVSNWFGGESGESFFAISGEEVSLGSGEGETTWTQGVFFQLFSNTSIGKGVGDVGANFEYSMQIAFKFIILIAFFLLLEVPLMGARIILLTILIELVVRKMFFPMAMASICSEGMRSPGVAYMKKLLAVYLRLAMCVVIALIADIIIGELLKYPDLSLPYLLLRTGCMYVIYLVATKLYANTSSLAGAVLGV